MEKYITRLFHVCITVEDIEEALKFYCDVLGLESIGSLRNEKADGAVLGFPGQEIEINADHLVGTTKENATVIDLIEYISPKTVYGDGPVKEMNRVGLTRMAFGVDNIDEIYQKLLKRGDIEFFCEPIKLNSVDGGWLKVVTFRDPFGITMEFIEAGR